METYFHSSPLRRLALLISFSVIATLCQAQSLEGTWQSGNYSIIFRQGVYTEVTNHQAISTGWYRFDGNNLYLKMSTGQQAQLPAHCNGNSLSLWLNSQWILLHAVKENSADTYSGTASGSTYPGGNEHIMKMTQDAVSNARRIADGGMTPEEYEQAKNNISIDTRAIMKLTQNVYHIQDLMKRADGGDYQAKQELEKQMQWVDQMSGMLQGWTASGQISNNVRRSQLALGWKRAAQHDREYGQYYARQGQMDRARFHAERAEDFQDGARDLLEQQ